MKFMLKSQFQLSGVFFNNNAPVLVELLLSCHRFSDHFRC